MLALAVAPMAGCAPPPVRSVATDSLAPLAVRSFTIPTDFSNGRVEISILSVYPYPAPVRLPLSVAASRGTISGPITARIVANGFGESGAPSEVQVRALTVAPVTVLAGQRRTTEIVWDGLDDHGVIVPADAYSLVLEFGIEDGRVSRRAIAGATVQYGR
ncbi:MAG: hypothetical protein ACYDAR_21990 [Thermomicrobiales bacterium]